MEIIEKLKPEIDQFNIRVQTCCAAKALSVQEVSKAMENLAVRCLICILESRGVFDRNKHKTLVELVDGLRECGRDTGIFFSYFVEEYLDGVRTKDEEDYPGYETIEAARQELMLMFANECDTASDES